MFGSITELIGQLHRICGVQLTVQRLICQKEFLYAYLFKVLVQAVVHIVDQLHVIDVQLTALRAVDVGVYAKVNQRNILILLLGGFDQLQMLQELLFV